MEIGLSSTVDGLLVGLGVSNRDCLVVACSLFFHVDFCPVVVCKIPEHVILSF